MSHSAVKFVNCTNFIICYEQIVVGAIQILVWTENLNQRFYTLCTIADFWRFVRTPMNFSALVSTQTLYIVQHNYTLMSVILYKHLDQIFCERYQGVEDEPRDPIQPSTPHTPSHICTTPRQPTIYYQRRITN